MARPSAAGIAAFILVLLVTGVCVRLGFWQLARLDDRRASNAALATALSAPAIELSGAALDSVSANPERFRFRRARAAGVYDPTGEFLLRGRARRGAPGVHLVAPLRLAPDGATILVDRGWLPSPDAATADPGAYRVATPVEEVGLILPLPAAEGPAVPATIRIGDGEVRSYLRMDRQLLQAATPGLLLPVYLQLLPGDSTSESYPIAAPIPVMDDGPHLGYAVQWFSFAAIALIGFGVVLLRVRRRG